MVKINMKIRQKIIAEIQEMAREEILSMISAGTYERIKKQDEHPEFRVYAIAHEGTAEGKIIGEQYIKQSWFKEAVKSVVDKIKLGLKFFHLHKAGTNDTENRQAVGEVVGKKLVNMNGKTYALVAAYVYPEFRDMPLDVASIEADIVYNKEGNTAKIDSVDKITGIALGNSAVISPGFAGATLLGAVQAFAAQRSGGKGSGKMTKAELKELREQIEEAGLSPSDVFGEEDLTQDLVVKKEIKKAVQGEYEHRKRTDEAFDKARADWEKEKSELQKRADELSSETAKLKVGGTLSVLAKERNLDDKQQKFVERNLRLFEVKDADKVKEELDSFITEQLKEFDEVSKLVTGEGGEDDKDKGKSKGTPSGDKDEPETNEDYENPEKNDFIPE